ncbi:uncharacterized protein LOC112572476 [Pomacea canaliculata]|uniref:uncharacterized protein LOC112572476 n=1 Tax=Pomacea canaliculata TaxID=400727 RepID=UPI000D732D73|nr:uncharacterized protein LOC112572476 [Pomacea canaliculata]
MEQRLVVVCFDPSKHSDYALDYYLKYVHKENTKVRVLFCPENWSNIGPLEGPTPGRLEELRAETRAQVDALREKAMEMLEAAQVTGQFVELVGKRPSEEIVKYASAEHASLIVMGSRGVSTIRRTILGSCSNDVLHHAHCPVLVCNHPHK